MSDEQWDAMEDERPQVIVHAQVPSSDDVRTFYEIPQVVADHIHEIAPDEPFVEALVQLFAQCDELMDVVKSGQAALHAIQDQMRQLGLGGQE